MDLDRVSVADVLGKLSRLNTDGFLSDEEFETQKNAFLSASESGLLSTAELLAAESEITELQKLADLVRSKVLTREQFESQKASLLSGEMTKDVTSDLADSGDPSKVDAVSIPAGWEWVLIVAGAMAAIGALLPWEQASSGLFSISRNGFQMGANLSFSPDGLIVIGLGIATALVGICRLTGRSFPRWVQSSPTILGAAILLVGILDERSLNNTVRGLVHQYPTNTYSVGTGIWLVITGGALTAFAGVSGWMSKRRITNSTASTQITRRMAGENELAYQERLKRQNNPEPDPTLNRS